MYFPVLTPDGVDKFLIDTGRTAGIDGIPPDIVKDGFLARSARIMGFFLALRRDGPLSAIIKFLIK